MRTSLVISRLLSRTSAPKPFPFAHQNVGFALNPSAHDVPFSPPQQGLKTAANLVSFALTGKVFYSSASDSSQDDVVPRQRTYADANLDSRMRMKAYRREALQQRYAAEMEQDAMRYDLNPAKLLQKGDPDTVQAIVKEVIQVGYFVTLPSGKEGFLPARELGTTGGLPILEKLFKVGQEITVRSVRIGGFGRDVVAIKKDTPVDMPDRPYQGFTGRNRGSMR